MLHITFTLADILSIYWNIWICGWGCSLISGKQAAELDLQESKLSRCGAGCRPSAVAVPALPRRLDTAACLPDRKSTKCPIAPTPIIGSQKGALEKGALKSVFWAINAAFYFDFAFIASSNGRRSSISFGYCVIINNRGCVLDASFNSTCSFAQEGVLCFF